MKWYLKDMEPIGFEGTNVIRTNWNHFWKKEVPEKKTVYIFDAMDERLQHFALSAKDWKAFKANKLGLCPVGCCGGLGGHRCLYHPKIDFEGDTRKIFKTKKKFIEFLKETCDG